MQLQEISSGDFFCQGGFTYHIFFYWLSSSLQKITLDTFLDFSFLKFWSCVRRVKFSRCRKATAFFLFSEQNFWCVFWIPLCLSHDVILCIVRCRHKSKIKTLDPLCPSCGFLHWRSDLATVCNLRKRINLTYCSRWNDKLTIQFYIQCCSEPQMMSYFCIIY